ncbi:M1 family metallopeptidase [Saprospiraceae bacterium]|nr:M1 family metallopeptidase [Saprospiraceae bacterium]MDA9332885.1 M1 family metallopeptidase [Saprospiraceae bacterium]MDB4162691.1 M1 family metallopeptidase [Saprospiraceae bacterium]MDB4824615.1 M1 family metallopeptidase [Saprospiraceae bacterium]MDB9914504.1 M1 family metallopeptidase [Saprospiraceae bacterium]
MKLLLQALFIAILTISISTTTNAQADRWQQSIKYKMDIDMDVKKNQYKGKQYIQYVNNSPDTLDKVFYHMYFNAFQPNSMMDVRSRTIADPDRRVGSRIEGLTKDEIGYIKVKMLKHQGEEVEYEMVGTILEVTLNEPIEPRSSTLFEMDYEAQIPLQVRRSGRDNAEGVKFSMAQWYPKMANYDYQGWSANPYVGREFYGIWGDYNVTIHIDKKYVVGATGQLQNMDEIGYGYGKVKSKEKKGKITYKFLAENVHDFAWGADPDYTHETYQIIDGPLLHFLYQPGEKTTENWQNLPRAMAAAYKWMSARYGKYPYDNYYFVQGGDGGMEYPQLTLITGERSYGSLVGVSIHEWMHSWYQMVLATNEALYPWMDEGFTSFGSTETMNYLKQEGIIPGEIAENPFLGAFNGQANIALSGFEEPLSTHADHYTTNRAYGVGSYIKGQVFLKQLEYVLGKVAFDKALLDYYDIWKFKHPNPNDFIRVFEKNSGLELDWYKEYMVNTTHYIDYALDTIVFNRKYKGASIELSRIGKMPMPLDVLVETQAGKKYMYNIPLQIMRGAKPKDDAGIDGYTVVEDWPWTNPTYSLKVPHKLGDIKKITIDPNTGMVDVDRMNNVWPRGGK